MTALLNGDDGIKGESDWRLKLLEDEKLLKKEVDNRVIVVGNGVWLEVWCQLWREKTFVMWRLVWMNKKEMIISFKIHQIQKWYSSISYCELYWNEVEKKFITFQMKCIYQLMIKCVIISLITRMKDNERWLKKDEFVYP